MKRLFSIILLLSLSISLYAGFSFRAFGDKPLYSESISDPYSFDSKFSVVYLPFESERDLKFGFIGKELDTLNAAKVNYDDKPQYILLSCNNLYNYKTDGEPLFGQLKASSNNVLFSFSYDGDKFVPFDAQINIAGYLSAVFKLSGSFSMYGFDGSYFVGGSAKFKDKYVVRAGIHHLSGHYGDEIVNETFLEKVITEKSNGLNVFKYRTNEDKYYLVKDFIEYVRDNCFMVGFSTDVKEGLRFYAEAEVPLKTAWVRPFVDVPLYGKDPSEKFDNLYDKVASDEGFISGNKKYIDGDNGASYRKYLDKVSSSYMALRCHTGLEYTKELSFANLVAGLDIQAHNHGSMKNDRVIKINDYYSIYNMLITESKKIWTYEVTASLGLDFGDYVSYQHPMLVNLQYHWGRFPLLNYFYNDNASYLSLSIIIK